MKRLITIFYFILINLSLNAQNEFKDKIESLLETCHERGIFNGNALVIKKNKVIYRAEKGYTDGSKNRKLNRESVFDIGSISKEFSAVGIMILQEKNLLDLNDKVSKYLLDLPSWSKTISIENLLQYSSGLPSIDWKNVHSDTDIYNSLKELKTLEFSPGNGYLYSNNNIFIQRRIIEKITEQTFNAFLEKTILQPLGLKSSLIDHQYKNPNFARAFNSNYINDEKLELKMSGSLCPSIDDLAKWVNQLMNLKIISQKSLFKLFKTYSKDSQSALGNGTFVDGKLETYVHHGSSLNYESIVFYDLKNEIMITLMTNSKSLKIGEIAEAIDNILKDKDYRIPQKSIYLTVREKTYSNVDKGIAYYKNLKNTKKEVYNFSNHWELAQLSYKLFGLNKNEDAVKILKLLVSELPTKSEEALDYLGSRILNENQIEKSKIVYELMTKSFPSTKSYEGLANANFKDKQYKIALNNYKKSLEYDPANKNSKKMILEIEKRK